MSRAFRVACVSGLILFAWTSLATAQNEREQKVRADRERVEAEGFWIYNDLPRAFEEAEESGKPILVVLRCLPCEECVKLDDELIDQDPVIKPLLKDFVCARVVGTNGLDLGTFQFDTDQSFAVFLLNADGTIYGRFGTRSHRTEWVGDVSVAGLARALEGALALHADYPNNKEALSGKRGPEPLFASPEKYPELREKYTSALDYEGNVVQSCIHCHQIGDAERTFYRQNGDPLPERVLFPYPHPKSIGLTLDPKERASVLEVADGSFADEAGFRAGDQIESLADQPLLSTADVQWVLHQTNSEGGTVAAVVNRDGKSQSLTLELPAGWRRLGDISWRSSSWGMRRMVTGGLLLEELPKEDRQRLRIKSGEMALRVKHVGQYGAHAAAKNRGFQEGDVLVSFDGRTDLVREGDLFHHAATECAVGEEVPVVVLRESRRVELKLPMQE
jgi:serine protease Do